MRITRWPSHLTTPRSSAETSNTTSADATRRRDILFLDGRALRLYRGLTSVWPLVQTPRAAWNMMRADWGRMADAGALTIKAVHDGRICVFALSGALDLTTAAEFLEYVARAVDDRTERFVLDLAGLAFLDCAGARALVMATYAAPTGCPVIVRSVSPPAARLIDLLNLDLQHLWQDPSAGLEDCGTAGTAGATSQSTALSDRTP